MFDLIKAEKMTFVTPQVFEEPTTVNISCPQYEGTDLVLRCHVTYPTGSNITATFNYGDGKSEEFNVGLGE